MTNGIINKPDLRLQLALVFCEALDNQVGVRGEMHIPVLDFNESNHIIITISL